MSTEVSRVADQHHTMLRNARKDLCHMQTVSVSVDMPTQAAQK